MRRAGVHIGALQTVAKLLGPSAYFKFYERNSNASARMRVTAQNFFQCRVTKAGTAASLQWRPMSPINRFPGLPRRNPTMTINTRIALGLSAAALSLSLALAPAFAADDMKKDDGMKKDTMSKDGMKKDDGMMKKDTMSKDGMKKDDGMMKKDK
jgi:pentapeptide MXKDX repeat protein